MPTDGGATASWGTDSAKGRRHSATACEQRLSDYDVLRLTDLRDFRRAATLYRQARSRGFTIRRTLDCLIASVCVREAVPILHADADFDRLVECTELQAYRAPPAPLMPP